MTNGVRKGIKRRGKIKYILHDGLWVCLSWIGVADKPGYDKGRESVAPEEKLGIIKLRQSCHLGGLNLVNLILNIRFCQRQC